MAFITNGITFTGPIDNLSAYKMKGTDKIVIRKKGGPSKEKIKTAPEFARTRENNAEFGGCAFTVKGIRQPLHPVKHLADYNFTPTLTTLVSNIQHLDEVNSRGTRSVNLSQFRYLLEGFQLNKTVIFDNVVKHPLQGMIARETGTATVQLPNLLPALNLEFPWEAPLYRFIIAFGTFSDGIFNGKDYDDNKQYTASETVYTDWHPVQEPFKAQKFELQLKDLTGIVDTTNMLLSIGIEMGTPLSKAMITRVKHTGCAKILAVG